MKKIFFLLFLSIFSSTVFAENYFCQNNLEVLPILQNGRIKPLYVHAYEMIKALTGKSKLKDLSAVEAYCLLSINSLGLSSNLKLEAKIEHVDMIKFFNLNKDQPTILYEDLILRQENIKSELQTIKNNDSYQSALSKLFDSIYLYQEIKSGSNWLLATNIGGNIQWVPLILSLAKDKVKDQAIVPILMNSKQEFDKLNPDHKYSLELSYAKAHLSTWALTFTILGLAALVLFSNFNIALSFASLSAIVQIILVTMRVIISGRAPITNMYETVLFSGLGSLVLSLILGHFKKERIFVYMGLCYNLCTLMMLNFANGMLTATISPLVPVLRDNFWLSTHVTMVILSYGALALSWILSNTVLFKRKWGTISAHEEASYSNIIYTTLKWGTVLLAGGVILGGVWADYSWGRFWGWDPKETWSLIVLCTYMAILHGRYTTWIKPHRFVTVTAGAFMTVMMAWFGVNYILASGLHSYGFSEGGALFLFSFFALQVIFIIVTTKASKK